MIAADSTPAPLVAEKLTKAYGEKLALDCVDLAIPAGHVVGLLGRNGAGKSTLLQLAAGLLVPTSGACRTLGRRSEELDTPELSRLGLVQQEARFVEWMTVAQHLEFIRSFYASWDRELEQRLVALLELPLGQKLAHLSTGDRQKAGIVLGVCHRPALLLLDEPMSSLDPIARTRMLDVILDRLRDDGCTVLISSHLLNDVEKIVDWIVTLDAGRVTENSPFDELQESFAEWTLTAPHGGLPAAFAEPFVLSRHGDDRIARLKVRTRDPSAAARLSRELRAEIDVRPLNLDEMFPLLIDQPKAAR